jgi:carboxylesterase type B
MIARALSAHNGKDAPVYRYRFNQLPYNTTAVSKGVGTGIEISYVFSDLVPNYPWDQALAYEMTSAWVSFAYNLNPNPGGSKIRLF